MTLLMLVVLLTIVGAMQERVKRLIVRKVVQGAMHQVESAVTG